MSRADRFDFTLDEETEKRLYDLLTDMDTRSTNRFWITDKRGYHAEYMKIIRCKDCRHSATGNYFSGMMCGRYRNEHGMLFISVNEDDFCSRAERKEE